MLAIATEKIKHISSHHCKSPNPTLPSLLFSVENWIICRWRYIRSRWHHRTPVLSKQKLVGLDQPAACWSYKYTCRHPTFKFQPLKNLHSKRKFTNQNCFPRLIKSTTLNLMVKSDLVTSGDGTIRFFIFFRCL